MSHPTYGYLMYYTVYKITNKINQKIYIGVHKTTNLEDNYMGSGKHLKRAKEKYGIENFEKNIIEIFDTPEMMYQYEALLVNEEFVVSVNTYNLKVGGYGGDTSSSIDYEKIKKNYDFSQCAIKMNNIIAEKRKNSEYNKRFLEKQKTFLNKKHSEETKRKIGEANSIHQLGEKNSQFGTMWIYNEEIKENKKIYKDEIIPDGWKKGRKMNFK